MPIAIGLGLTGKDMIMSNDWVGGEGRIPNKLMICGEAPGKEELMWGRPFIGATGKELDNLLHRIIGIWREEVYVTNFSKTPLNDKKTMTPEEIEVMGEVLRDEIEDVNPDVILTLGAISTHWFLGDRYDMETLNALPHLWEGRIVVPSFHPAAAFRDTALMSWVIEAFEVTKLALAGKAKIRAGSQKTQEEGMLFQLCQDTVTLDTEAYVDGKLFMVTASSCEGMTGYCYADDKKMIHHIRDHVKEKNVTTLLHNALYDLPQLRKVGIIPSRWIDTMMIAFLLQTLPLGLKNLAYKLCGMKMKEYEEVIGDAKDLSEIDQKKAIAYACQDADATLRVYNKMRPLWYEGMDEVLQRDMEIMPMVVNMMDNGMKVDVEYLNNLYVDSIIKNDGLRLNIEKHSWEGFNPASAPQVSKLLYERLKLGRGAKIRKTKWGESTDRKSLKKLNHPVVNMIEEWRGRDTLIDKFLGVLPDKVDGDGRIHTKISIARVKHSGRLASSNPNLMAQPVRTEEGMATRNGFIASNGYKLVQFDYNQIEMRLMAHLSQDPTMIEVYRKNGDIHTDTAMRVFGIKNVKDVDEMKHRYPAKRVGFGVINLITAHGLARELAEGGAGVWTEDRCQELLDIWFSIHPGVKSYFSEVERKAFRERKVVDMWGRMEFISEVMSVFPHIREAGVRRAVNQGIQSGAQGIIKEAMRELWPMVEEWNKRYDDQKGGCSVRPLIQIHDDLTFEIVNNMMGLIIPQIKKVMENVVKLSIPITVEVKTGERWGSMSKWGKL